MGEGPFAEVLLGVFNNTYFGNNGHRTSLRRTCLDRLLEPGTSPGLPQLLPFLKVSHLLLKSSVSKRSVNDERTDRCRGFYSKGVYDLYPKRGIGCPEPTPRDPRDRRNSLSSRHVVPLSLNVRS